MILNISHIHSSKVNPLKAMETSNDQKQPSLALSTLPGASTLRSWLVLSFSATPKSHHLETSTVHLRQLEGTCPVGRIRLLEEQKCTKYSQTMPQAIPLHLHEENNYRKKYARH